MGLAILTLFVMSPVVSTLAWPRHDYVVDFFQEWASARNLLNGLPTYTDLRITTPLYLKPDHFDPGEVTVEVNAHPPTSVLLALPFALFDYNDAVLLWNLVSLALMAASLCLIKTALRIPFPAEQILPTMALLSLCGPLLLQVLLGQLNLVLLFLLTLVWASDRMNRPILAGILLGSATAIKLFPGFLFLFFLLRGNWKAVLGGGITLVALTAVTAALLGTDAYRDYICEVLPRVARFRGNWNNASVVGFWSKLFDPVTVKEHVVPLWRSATVASAGILVSCTAIVAILGRTVRRAGAQHDADLAFGLAIVAMLLISPLTWEHSFLLLPIPLATIWVDISKSRVARGLFLATLPAFWLIPMPFYYIFIHGGRTHGVATPLFTLTLLSYQFYALLGLFCLGIYAAESRRGMTAAGGRSTEVSICQSMGPMAGLRGARSKCHIY
jgi:Glycosyltransferase family 87